MARGSKKEEKKEAFKTFNIMGSNKNNFEGRVYLEPKTTDKGARFALSITINDVTIKCASLWVPADDDKDCSIMFPSFKGHDGTYVDFVILYDDKIRKDSIEVANKIGDMVMSE